MTNTAEQTLASIVTEHSQTAMVLEKFNLDFCCKGKRTLAEACLEKGLSVEAVMEELEASSKSNSNASIPFTEMNVEQLIRYILVHHHFYVKQAMPAIEEHLTKVASKHGAHFSYLKEVLQLFIHLKNEMSLHLQKEEVVLFPRIKEIEALYNYKQKKNIDASYIFAPVGVMETEHDEAGEIMNKIRQLTDNYKAPIEACTTFKLVMEELKKFEEDLHKHVHLENNLLFPVAENMLAAVSNII
jgi:regulator of cell morphogenesis and NO signaling